MQFFGWIHGSLQEEAGGFTKEKAEHHMPNYALLRFIAWFTVLLGIPLVAQTQVDLRTQTKDIDFRAASSTKPLKTGGALPATCSQGDMFFLTTAAAGANLYGCSGNTWTLQAGGGTGSVQVQNSGAGVGTRPILDFSAGQGVLLAVSDTGQSIAIQTSLDTTQVQTGGTLQSGAALTCASASASGTAYTCALSPTLRSYTNGMILRWKPDVDGSGGPTTLNVDTLGQLPVKLADGATDPTTGDVKAGRMLEIWYDGAAFRLLGSLFPAGILGEAQPGCAATLGGRLWYVPGGTGSKDSLSVCAKDATNTYAWRTLY
jgi:hypothetical protein